MKKLLVIVFLGFFALNANAQKIKLVKGNLNFLKGVTTLKIEFTYGPNLRVGKMTEKAYVEKKVGALNAKKAGRGNYWKSLWYQDRKAHYQPKFIDLFNKVLLNKGVFVSEDAHSDYVMIVNTTFIEPGFDVGVMSKPANINLVITFINSNHPSKVLAKFTIHKSPGTSVFGNDYDTAVRLGEAYARAGKHFAKFLLKKRAF